MFRHLITVLISALVGSAVGTLIWTAIEGGIGVPNNPVRVAAGIAVATLWFTIPGAIALMAVTFAFANRGVSQPQAAILVIIIGTALGAAMLAFFSPSLMPIGAMFGGFTAALFVSTLWVLRAYPATRR
jgi:hypothetical protein